MPETKSVEEFIGNVNIVKAKRRLQELKNDGEIKDWGVRRYKDTHKHLFDVCHLDGREVTYTEDGMYDFLFGDE
jgi:diketogulonate reductase-like aldo/keto reductase